MTAAPEPLHLAPTAELAERVLLPGDPRRALTVAGDLLEGARTFNDRRGLEGYTGLAPDGAPLTIQSTGMGGPSAAIVVEELVSLGARRLVRIGTCGALGADVGLGRLATVTAALPGDGASLALGAEGEVAPDPGLTRVLLTGEGDLAVVTASVDLFYDPRPRVEASWRERGAQVLEMEAATVLRVCALRGARGACLLAVTDGLAAGGRIRLDTAAIERAGIRLGRAALAGLERDERG